VVGEVVFESVDVGETIFELIDFVADDFIRNPLVAV